MSRQKIVDALDRYRKSWPEEAETILRFRKFVVENPNCFERSLPSGHITGSAWIVNKAGSHALLTHHRKLEAWFQLGGHADGESDPQAVSLKEAVEESGIQAFTFLDEEIFDIDIHLIPARKSDPEHYHYDIRYLLQPTDSEEIVISEESLDLQWIPLSKLKDYTQEASMLRMANKWSQLKDRFIEV